jgi:hypothetical protein
MVIFSLFFFFHFPLSEQSVAQAVVNGLDLGVVLQSVGTELAAQTGLLEATEGSLVGDHVVAVDPDSTIELLVFYLVKIRERKGSLPSLEGVGDTDGGVDVLGVNGGGKTVAGVVTDLDGLSLVLELLDSNDGTEDLLLGDLHVGSNVSEDGGLDEIALGAVALATNSDGGTLLLAVVDVLHDTVELELRDLGTLEGVLGEGVTQLVLSRTLLEAGDELVVDTLLDQQAGTGTAALSVVEEDTEVGPGDSVVDIGVIEDDVGGLTTQLEGDLLQVGLGSGL